MEAYLTYYFCISLLLASCSHAMDDGLPLVLFRVLMKILEGHPVWCQRLDLGHVEVSWRTMVMGRVHMFMVDYRFLSHPSPRNMSPSQSSCTVCIVLMSPCLINTKSCHCHCPRRCHPLALPQPPPLFFLPCSSLCFVLRLERGGGKGCVSDSNGWRPSCVCIGGRRRKQLADVTSWQGKACHRPSQDAFSALVTKMANVRLLDTGPIAAHLPYFHTSILPLPPTNAKRSQSLDFLFFIFISFCAWGALHVPSWSPPPVHFLICPSHVPFHCHQSTPQPALSSFWRSHPIFYFIFQVSLLALALALAMLMPMPMPLFFLTCASQQEQRLLLRVLVRSLG